MVITDILDTAGVDYKVALSNKDEITLCCPFCAERDEAADNRYRLGINVRKGAGSCFNCKWKGKTVKYIAKELGRVFGVRASLRIRKASKTETVTTPEIIDLGTGLPGEYEPLTGELDSVGKEARKYLKNRGVSLLQIVTHKIGFAAVGTMAWRVLFPVQSNGLYYGCVGRAFWPDMQPKYLNTPGLKLLWNAHKPSGKAIVVEGVLDALRVETALLQVRNATAVARLGSAITVNQLMQLKEFDSVVVLPDWDKAGVDGAAELCSRCASRGMNVSVSIPQRMSGIDPGDMLPEQIMEYIGEAVPWNDTAGFKLRAAAQKH